MDALIEVFFETPGYPLEQKSNGQWLPQYTPQAGSPRRATDILTVKDAKDGLARRGLNSDQAEAELRRLSRAGQIAMFRLNRRAAVTPAIRDSGIDQGGESREGILLTDPQRFRR